MNFYVSPHKDHQSSVVDARKTLKALREEWSTCTRCDLGVRREEVSGEFVFGEGTRRGIMFIGDGPDKVDEEEGHPFVGKSGEVLQSAISNLGITNYWITNCVSCRSCAQAYTSEGQPITSKARGSQERLPVIRDQPPLPSQSAACLARLHEEIYLVDPILIVALGSEAASILRGKPVSLSKDRGNTEMISVPGAWHVPVLTEKKKVWGRKVHGEWAMPTTANMVRYLMLLTLHPAYDVLRSHGDQRPGNPVQRFVEDMKKAVGIYDRYMTEVYGDSYVHVERKLHVEDMEI